MDGHIVFGLKGIKGMGDAAARAIVAEREENGPFNSFMDFVDRMSLRIEDNKRLVNNKAIEVLIKTGAFDKFGQNRPTLLANLDKVVAYCDKKNSGGEFGQVSLFEDSGEKEFSDYVFEEVEDTTRMDKLSMEKELIGCYVSGHPLDDYKQAAEHASLNSKNMEREARYAQAEKEARDASGGNDWRNRNSGKEYTALGMITTLRTITTKKGAPMAFATLQDYHGSIDLTFFPKTWEVLRNQVHTDGIYAFKGKIDASRGIDQASMIVDALEDINTLQTKAIQELHIQLESGLNDERQIFDLKEYLFGNSGNCAVYFHIDSEGQSFTIKANSQLTAPSSKEFIDTLKDLPFVHEVWTV